VSWRVKKFLQSLLDNEWHLTAPTGIGVNTVQMCIHHGFIKTKKVDRKREGGIESYRIAFRITRHGKDFLESKKK
jgi:hypothetical protein